MSTLLERARRGEPITDFEIIDMHGHLGPCGFLLPDLDPAALVAGMDRMGVKTTVVSHMCSLSRDAAQGNREVLAAMQAFPGRLLGYAAFWPESEEAVRAEVEWAVTQGFTGFKLHNANGFPYTHPAYAPVYECAQEQRRPVLFHTWGQETEFAQLADEVAPRYPEMSVLLAHAGSANADAYVAVARTRPNIYLEVCYSAAPRGMVARLVNKAGAEKVVWGSDASFYSQVQQFGKVLGADLPEDVLRQVLSTNAQRILERIV